MTAPRILYLTPGCFDKGGISRYARYQIAALREIHGAASIRVLSMLGPAPGGFEEPFAIDWAAGGNSLRHKLAFAARALAETLRWRPTHIHTGHVNQAPLARALARLNAATSILNIYGLEIWSGLSPARRSGLAAMDAVIADCHHTADYAVTHGLRATRPTVIWDCVDLDRFTPGACPPEVIARYGLPDPARHPIVLTLGRIAERAMHKGYERLLHAFAQVAPRHPDARLVFAGSGDAVDRMKALATSLGVAERTVFTGSVDEADLPAVYRAGAIFSLVSDRGNGRGEGIPLTPLEAGACGVPILVGDQDGSREAVVAGRNGFVCPSLDVADQAARLDALLGDPALRRQLGAGARAVAEEAFGYPRFVKEHRTCYGGLPTRDARTQASGR